MEKSRRGILFVLLVLLSSIAIQIPLHNRGLLFFDEGVIYNYAVNVLEGRVFFRDIFSYMFPGMFYTLALLYKIFGVSLIISRYAVAVVFSATAILVFLISRQLMDEWVALLTAIAFTAYRLWAFQIWNYSGYATFSIFFLSFGLLLLLRFVEAPRPGVAFLVGLFVAVATMFKQDYGVFTGFGMLLVILLWPYLRPKDVEAPVARFLRTRATGAYIAGGVVVCLPILIYFALEGALDDLVRQTLLIPLTLETKRQTTQLIPIFPFFGKDAFVRGRWNEYAPSVTFMRLLLNLQTHTPAGFLYTRTPVWEIFLKLIHYMPYLSSFLVGAILAKGLMKGATSLRRQKATAVLMFSVSLFLTQHRPFDFAHLMQMYLPVFLLLGFLVHTLHQRIRSNKKLLYPVFGGLGIFFGLYLYYTIAYVFFIVKLHPAKLEGPRANIYLSRNDRDTCSEAIKFITENTSPGEPIYVLPYHGLFYFLAQRPNPTRFENLWPVKVVKDMDREIIDTLERERVEYIVEFPQVLKEHGSYKEFAPEIADYVRTQFVPEKDLGNPEEGLQIIVMRRKHEATGTTEYQIPHAPHAPPIRNVAGRHDL